MWGERSSPETTWSGAVLRLVLKVFGLRSISVLVRACVLGGGGGGVCRD